MIKLNLKAVTSAIAGACLITTMFSACSQAGTSRAPGQYGGRQMQNTTQRLGGNNLLNATTQLRQGNQTGLNYTGTNMGINQGTTLGNYGTNMRDGLRTNTGTNLGANLGNNVTGTTTAAPNMQKADNIKRQIMRLNGVDTASVIVVGNTALVGCKLKGNVVNTTAVKNNITNKVKEVDNTITTVTVSESPDIMNRMSRLGTNIGNKTGTFTDEFTKLLKGVTPAR